LQKLWTLFASPVQPTIADYYEPWTYDYQTLIDAPLGDDFPVARPKSLLTGEHTKISWSANWDDNLGGSTAYGDLDPIVEKLRRESEEAIKFSFEQTFMFYLPRICEHCLNPSCMASCPSGAIYKRSEDGIVLVDQDQCRGWRQCITGCPYKKMYFNHKSGKAEKCTLCYPRIEVGQPTVCSETCVGRLRYLGIFLYDADAVTDAASTADEKDLYEAQLDLLLDPNDPEVIAAARIDGIPDDWLDAARRSPVSRWPRSTVSRCPCIRNTAPCRWSGTSRRSRRLSTCSPTKVTMPKVRARCSVRSTLCASRSNTSLNCSLRETPT
jgi:nitrate reductase beta subunit